MFFNGFNENFYLLQVQLSAVTPPAAPAVPSGLEGSLSALSISSSAPPTMPSELQTGLLHFHSETFVKSTSFKFDTRQEYSHLMFNVSLLPIQVCLQSLFCPPPLTPPSPLWLRWILPLPAWTQPPRYQVISARFTPFLNKDTSLCVHITHIQWTYSCWRFPHSEWLSFTKPHQLPPALSSPLSLFFFLLTSMPLVLCFLFCFFSCDFCLVLPSRVVYCIKAAHILENSVHKTEEV